MKKGERMDREGRLFALVQMLGLSCLLFGLEE